MSTDPSILLRMLEPAVRPGGLASGVTPAKGKTPFEQQSFDQLLKQVGQPNQASASGSVDQAASPGVDPLAALSGLGQIENAALRDVLTQHLAAGGDESNEN